MRPSPGLVRAVVVGGLVAGALDISDALIFHGARGVAPIRILQAIASGVLGRDAFAGGVATAALGLALHFFIATSAAAIYAVASTQAAILVRRPVFCGAIYGLVVYGVMSYIVLPLSRFRPGSSGAGGGIDWGLVNLLLAHIFCVGLPIALATRWASRRQLPI